MSFIQYLISPPCFTVQFTFIQLLVNRFAVDQISCLRRSGIKVILAKDH